MSLRTYQQEALRSALLHLRFVDPNDDEEEEELFYDENDFDEIRKCVLKLACGTGKSIIKKHLLQHFDPLGGLVICVFPSLALRDQFHSEYLTGIPSLGVCSEQDFTGEEKNGLEDEEEEGHQQQQTTTSPESIREFLLSEIDSKQTTFSENAKRLLEMVDEDDSELLEDHWKFRTAPLKCITVTYHSLELLETILLSLREEEEKSEDDEFSEDDFHQEPNKYFQPSLMIFDEAHWTSKSYFCAARTDKVCKHQVYLTATPSTKMREEECCGPIVYDYSCARAIEEGYLAPYNLHFLFHANHDVQKSRVDILQKVAESTGNKRVLAFSSRVNPGLLEEEEFVEEEDDNATDHESCSSTKNEKSYVSVSEFVNECLAKGIQNVWKMDASVKRTDRRKILEEFAAVPDDELAILSSCRTIGEGIDTKNANMVYFVDSKKSTIEIIQNIGRGLRKTSPDDDRVTTVLIPVFIDMEEYADARGDVEKVNAIFTKSLTQCKGDFSMIANVCAALKCDDEEMFHRCILNYSSKEETGENGSEKSSSLLDDAGNDKDADSQKSRKQSSLKFEFSKELFLEWNLEESCFQEGDERRKDWSIGLANSVFKKSSGEIWLQHLNSLKEFIDQNKRRPAKGAKEEKEKFLVNWLGHQLKNYKKCVQGMKDPARRKIWKHFMNEYSEFFVSTEELWIHNLKFLKVFIDQNQKRPSHTAKEENEKFLASWLSAQLTNFKKNEYGMKYNVRCEFWKQFMEDYSKYFLSPEEEWAGNFDALTTFIDQNKRRPSKKAKDKNEKFLGIWLSWQLAGYKNYDHGMQDSARRELWNTFQEKYFEYFMSPEEKWISKLKLLKIFINQNQRRPSSISKKDTNEKILGIWLTAQLTKHNKYKERMKCPALHALWKQFMEDYSDYFITQEEEWINNLKSLKTFIDRNQKRPLTKETEDVNEKFLGKWLSHQLLNYKKCKAAMKDFTRRKLFEEFVNLNKPLFPNFEFVELKIKENELTKVQLNQLNNQQKRFEDWKNYLLEHKRLITQKENPRLQNLIYEFNNWLKDPPPHLSSLLQEYKEFIESEPVAHLFVSSSKPTKRKKDVLFEEGEESSSISSESISVVKKPRVYKSKEGTTFQEIDCSKVCNNNSTTSSSRGNGSSSNNSSKPNLLLPFNLEKNPFKEATNEVLVSKLFGGDFSLQEKDEIRVLTLDGEFLRTTSTFLSKNASIKIDVAEMDEETFRKQSWLLKEKKWDDRVSLHFGSLQEFGKSKELETRIRVHAKKHRETCRPYYQVIVYFILQKT